jgi:GGDEF domain-containing protein
LIAAAWSRWCSASGADRSRDGKYCTSPALSGKPLRACDRPAQTQPVKRQRRAFRASKSESVTISIGVAQRNGKLVTPASVIKAADKALYRAKRGGRNQVSR